MTLPATAPTMISIRATEMAAQIDIRDAARARPIHSADASQTLSMAILLPALPQRADEPTERGARSRNGLAERDSPGLRQTYRPCYTVGVISLIGGFGELHPHLTPSI